MSEPWAERALRRLEAGGKRGSARRAVVEALDRQTCAVSAAQLDDALRAEGRAVGRATVYRTLEQLRELGLVQRLELGREGARYEADRGGSAHHDHLVCDRCGTVVPFVDPGLERALARLERTMDFEVAGHDVVLHGLCTSCAA